MSRPFGERDIDLKGDKQYDLGTCKIGRGARLIVGGLFFA